MSVTVETLEKTAVQAFPLVRSCEMELSCFVRFTRPVTRARKRSEILRFSPCTGEQPSCKQRHSPWRGPLKRRSNDESVGSGDTHEPGMSLLSRSDPATPSLLSSAHDVKMSQLVNL